MSEVDLAIVGGGLVGASLAIALRPTGLRVALVEGVAPDASLQPSFDDRTTALGNGTRRTFEALGLWQAIAPHAAPIRAISSASDSAARIARTWPSAIGCVRLCASLAAPKPTISASGCAPYRRTASAPSPPTRCAR